MLKQNKRVQDNQNNSFLCCCGGSASTEWVKNEGKPKTTSKISLTSTLKMKKGN